MRIKTTSCINILFLMLVAGVTGAWAQIPLNYSSFLGGAAVDDARAVAVAPDGCIWVCGYTLSSNFPLVNPIDSTLGGTQDAFVCKFSADGSKLLFSTYLGGSSADLGMGIAVDSAGNAYITGYTDSADFPTLNAFQPSRNGFYTNMFICKLNASGTMIYSSYLGGSFFQYASDVDVDASGCAYVAGRSYATDFPTVNAYQAQNNCTGGGYNFTLTKVAADGASLVYSTYLGGSGTGHEDPRVDVTADGIACFCGSTTSTDYPVTANAFQATHAGPASSWDVVVSVFSADGSSLTYSTFLGGTEDLEHCADIAISDDGSITLAGMTQSDNFPVINAVQSTMMGVSDLFVTRLTPSGAALAFSTYLGGYDIDHGMGLALDDDGSVIVVGFAESTNFPVYKACQSTNAGDYDGVVTKLAPDGRVYTYSTYLGGGGTDYARAVAIDADGRAIVVGRTQSADFPTVQPSQPVYGGSTDAFISRLAETPYCDADGGCDQYISRVRLNTIDNVSACDGYGDYTALSTDMTPASTYGITVTNGNGYTGDVCHVWVDWNQNGKFSDTGEHVVLNGGPAEFTGSITVPADALFGKSRLRVRLWDDGDIASCGTYPKGEVEDYTIFISKNNDTNMIDWNGNLVADFGDNGLWYNDGSSWAWMTNTGDVGRMVVWDGKLVVDFGWTSGLYYYDGAWQWLSNNGNVNAMAAWNNGTSEVLAVDFGQGRGIYTYDGAWQWLSNKDNVNAMTAWNNGTNEVLAVDFGQGRGIYTYDGAWQWLSNKDNVSAMTAWNTVTNEWLTVDFGKGRGLYAYDGSWQWLSNKDDVNAITAWNGKLIVDFGNGRGVYNYDTAWHWMTNKDAVARMVTWNDGTNDILAFDFGSGRNMYNYNGSWAWMKNANDVPEMCAWDNGLAVDFGPGVGVYNYDGSWHQLKNRSTAE